MREKDLLSIGEGVGERAASGAGIAAIETPGHGSLEPLGLVERHGQDLPLEQLLVDEQLPLGAVAHPLTPRSTDLLGILFRHAHESIPHSSSLLLRDRADGASSVGELTELSPENEASPLLW